MSQPDVTILLVTEPLADTHDLPDPYSDMDVVMATLTSSGDRQSHIGRGEIQSL